MSASTRTWGVLAAVYAAFFAWYTSFGGPLDDEEVRHYLAVLSEGGMEPDRLALFETFLESDTGDDFAMLNAIEMRAEPLPVEGVPPGESSSEMLGRYTRPFLGRALLSAAHPIFFGSAATGAVDLWGIEGAEQWTNGGVVRYRSRRDLMEQITAIGPSGIHEYKIAAMSKTIAFPVDPWFHLGDPRLLLALVLFICGLLLQLRRSTAGTTGATP